MAAEPEVRWTSCDSGMCTVTDSSVEVEDFLLRGSFPFSWLAVCADEDDDLRFLVLLGWEFFLLCLFEGFPVI